MAASRMVEKEGHVSVPLVANTRDIGHAEGEALLKARFVGPYHAIRLGEGRSTPRSQVLCGDHPGAEGRRVEMDELR